MMAAWLDKIEFDDDGNSAADRARDAAIVAGSQKLLRAIERARGQRWTPQTAPRRQSPRAPRQVVPRPATRVFQRAIGKTVGEAVIDAVADAFAITPEELIGRSKFDYYARARSVAVKLLEIHVWADGTPRFSYPMIAKILGGRDHTTILNARKKFPQYCDAHPSMREIYERLERQLNAS